MVIVGNYNCNCGHVVFFLGTWLGGEIPARYISGLERANNVQPYNSGIPVGSSKQCTTLQHVLLFTRVLFIVHGALYAKYIANGRHFVVPRILQNHYHSQSTLNSTVVRRKFV
jgi:hypothetical protein